MKVLRRVVLSPPDLAVSVFLSAFSSRPGYRPEVHERRTGAEVLGNVARVAVGPQDESPES